MFWFGSDVCQELYYKGIFHFSTGITRRPDVITAPVMRYFLLLRRLTSVQVGMAAVIL